MSKPTVVAMKSTSGLPPVMAAPGLQATGEQPSAPAAASRVAESFGLRQPDPMDGQDGVNDSSNTDIDAFLSRVGTACPGLDPPRPGVDPSWPPLPEGALEVRGEYFRKPDFTVAANGQAVGGQGAEPRTYVQMLSAAMEALGVASKRKAGSACARGLGAALLSATGVGACFVGSRTRRLEPGEIAFFHDADKRPRFVAGGWSLEPNPFHSGFERFDTNQQYIQFEGVIHIVRVQPGTYVRAVRNGHSLLLEAGENNEVGVHVMVEPNFSIVGQLGGAAGGAVHPDGAAVVRVDASHIDASPLHILNVPPDRVIAVTVNRKPHVLFEGRHVIESPTLVAGNDAGLYSLAKSFSVDGMIHYCVVYPGLLGGVKVADRACFVESPRALWFYSPHVEIMEPVALESEMTSFTSLTRLIVDDFKLALIRAKDGALVVLTPGVHVLKRPVIHLATYSTEWKHIREDLTAITADPLDVKLTMTASFRVCDVAAHYKAGDPEQIMRDCAEMAKSTMSEIIRSLRFEETLMAKRVDDGREAHRAEEEKKQQQKEQRDLEGGGIDDFLDEAPPNDIIRDQWDAISSARTATFVEFLKSTYGVQLDRSVWGFQNFDLCSSTHQEMLAQAVFGRAEARAERVKLDLAQETALVRKATAKIEAELKQYQLRLEAETQREVELIQVRAREEVRNAEVEANFSRKEKEREIEMADARARADASFYEVQRRADADAYAVEARAKAARRLYTDAPQEFDLEIARIQAQTVTNMKPQVFLGDVGGASLQKALALMVGRMSGAMAEEHGGGGRPGAEVVPEEEEEEDAA